MIPDHLRYADPKEEPMFITAAPSGNQVEVVDRRTYERVVAAFQWKLREQAES